MSKVIKNIAVERIYPDDKRVKPQTVAHHMARYKFASTFKGDTALDICCGTGYGSEMLRKAGFATLGIDISRTAINYARRHYKDCDFVCAPAQVTEYEPGFWDLVVLFEGIEHLPKRDGINVLKRVRKSLSPKGVFLISLPRLSNPIYNTYHVSEWSYESLRMTLKKYFKHVKILGQDWDTSEITTTNVKQNDFWIGVCRK